MSARPCPSNFGLPLLSQLALRPLMVLVALLLFQGAAPSFAQEQGSGGLAALELPIGARPLGMGRAFVASTGDLQGLLYNPAGLASRDSIGLTFSRYQGASGLDVNGNFGAVSFPVLAGAATLALSYEDLGEIDLTGTSPDPLGTLDLNNLLLVGSYALELRPSVSLGASVKYLTSDLAVSKGDGFALDAGALLRPWRDFPLLVGLAVLNVGPDVEFKLDESLQEEAPVSEGDPLPSRFRWGAAIDLRELTKSSSQYGLKLAADVEHNLREFGDVSFFGGAAIDYRQLVVLRGGVLRLDNAFGGEAASGASLGIGVQWQGLRIDVARELGVNEVGDETHFSVGVDF